MKKRFDALRVEDDGDTAEDSEINAAGGEGGQQFFELASLQ
jgi:hypothetical protein